MSGIKKFGFLALIWGACMAAQFAVSPAAQAQAAVTSGFLKSMTGPVFIRRGNAREVPAKPGDLLGPPVTIRAGAGSEAVLLFADGQSVTLGGDSVLRIDSYQFDTANVKASRANLLLEYGRMRVVTGAIHTDNPSALRIGAGSASVSILSKDVTAFVVEIARDEKERGWAAATIGAIAIQTPSGRIPEVAADQFASWQPRVPLSPPLPLAAAPAAYQAIVTASRATVEGSGTPVDVQSAAIRAALSMAEAAEKGAPSSTTTLSLDGQLNLVSGKVFITRNGVQAEARIGDTFGPGTVINTNAGGEVGLLFSEGVYASLGENSTLRISAAQASRPEAPIAPLNLVTGKMSFVTWDVPTGNAAALGVTAGDAYIAVVNKGMAAFVVEVDSKQLRTGSAAVLSGEVSVQPPDSPPVVLSADKFRSWRPGEPSIQGGLADAPRSLQQAFTDVLATSSRSAEVVAELASLPATAAGPSTAPAPTPNESPQPVTVAQAAPPPPSLPPAVFLPPVSSGGGGGCVGSPC